MSNFITHQYPEYYDVTELGGSQFFLTLCSECVKTRKERGEQLALEGGKNTPDSECDGVDGFCSQE